LALRRAVLARIVSLLSLGGRRRVKTRFTIELLSKFEPNGRSQLSVQLY